MKPGELVRNLYSESGMLGLIIQIDNKWVKVLWSDGRFSRINEKKVEAVK